MDAVELPISTFEFQDGRRFVPTARKKPNDTPFVHEDGKEWSEEDYLGFIGGLWHEAFDARKAELERLKQNSLYYDGFHYVNAWMNRVNSITNRVYEMVEAQVAIAVAACPRPEIVPRGWDDTDRAERLQAFAEAVEDTANFDHAVYLAARDKYIFGYSIWLLSFDPKTLWPFIKNFSVFHFYPDPAGRNEDECAYFCLGSSISTHRLRAMFPEMAEKILPDSIASPAWDVTVRPWREFLEFAGSMYASPISADTALAARYEEVPPGRTNPETEGIMLVASTGDRRDYGMATYVVTFLVADEGECDVEYDGMWYEPDGTTYPGKVINPEPRAESGWWLLTYTSTGVQCHPPEPLDEAFMGLPFVIDRHQQRTDRFESPSDVDQVIPMQREHNRRKALMMRALELAANPPVIATNGHGMQADKGTVQAGEILTINRGSQVDYLEYGGPSAAQFEMLANTKIDIQGVSGVPDVQMGIKPAGVQAAAAIGQLDQSSMRRMNAKEEAAHRARALLVHKLMYMIGKRSMKDRIHFSPPAGVAMQVTSDELCSPYAVRYAKGSGSAEGRQELRDSALMFFQSGVIDAQELLSVFQWPGRARMVKRLEIARAAAEAAAKTAGKDPGATAEPAVQQ